MVKCSRASTVSFPQVLPWLVLTTLKIIGFPVWSQCPFTKPELNIKVIQVGSSFTVLTQYPHGSPFVTPLPLASR